MKLGYSWIHCEARGVSFARTTSSLMELSFASTISARKRGSMKKDLMLDCELRCTALAYGAFAFSQIRFLPLEKRLRALYYREQRDRRAGHLV